MRIRSASHARPLPACWGGFGGGRGRRGGEEKGASLPCGFGQFGGTWSSASPSPAPALIWMGLHYATKSIVRELKQFGGGESGTCVSCACACLCGRVRWRLRGSCCRLSLIQGFEGPASCKFCFAMFSNDNVSLSVNSVEIGKVHPRLFLHGLLSRKCVPESQ